MSDDADDFRKALMREAYSSFLDWAWHKDEIMEQYLAYIEEAKAQGGEEDTQQSFQQWVTETYWGDEDITPEGEE